MSTENDNLTDSLQYVRRQVNAIVAAFFDKIEEQSIASTASIKPKKTNFHIGEFRVFAKDGESYQVISPIKYLNGDWLMRVRLKNGDDVEYLLNNISSDSLYEKKENEKIITTPTIKKNTAKRKNKETWKIWCDGSCDPKSGTCAWGAIVESPQGDRTEHLGYADDITGTSYTAEIFAAKKSLLLTPKDASVVLHSDSRPMLEVLRNQVPKWNKNGWTGLTKPQKKNKDLWESLSDECQLRKVTLEWVQGHSGHPENARADFLAKKALRLALDSASGSSKKNS